MMFDEKLKIEEEDLKKEELKEGVKYLRMNVWQLELILKSGRALDC